MKRSQTAENAAEARKTALPGVCRRKAVLATIADATCAVCGKPFVRRNTMQRVCRPLCALALVRSDRKAEWAEFRKRKEAAKPRAQWLKEAQAAVNRYCRLRDIAAGRGCITCGAYPANKPGGTMDAGHFRSVGAAPHLRFYTPQIRLQCVACNRHQGGRALDFRRALVREHGEEWVDRIEGWNAVRRFDVEYLRRLKRIASLKASRVEKRLARTEGQPTRRA